MDATPGQAVSAADLVVILQGIVDGSAVDYRYIDRDTIAVGPGHGTLLRVVRRPLRSSRVHISHQGRRVVVAGPHADEVRRLATQVVDVVAMRLSQLAG